MPPAVDIDSDDIKRQYAVELVKHRNSWMAAQALYPTDVLTAIKVEQTYKNDPVVAAHIDKLQKDRTIAVLPTKEDLLRELWKIGKAPNELSTDKIEVRDRLAALKMYAEISDFVPSKTANAGAAGQANPVPAVLMVPQFSSPEEWMAIAKEQQRKLIAEAHGTTG